MTTIPAPPKFKFAACQLKVTADKESNIENARKAIEEAAREKAQVVALPECFVCPYSNACFPAYAEEAIGGPVSQMLSDAAKSNKVYLIGGSFPEKDHGKLYNTCLIYGPQGNLLGKHRKLHLFDIDIPGEQTVWESDTLTAGDSFTVVETEFCKIGVAISYDIRFPELAMLYAKAGAKFIIYPALNIYTGPLHWELLQRIRAVDNQVYVSAVSPAGIAADPPSTEYEILGQTSVIDPWGNVIASADNQPRTIYADIDMSEVDKFRANIPVTTQKRHDLYQVTQL